MKVKGYMYPQMKKPVGMLQILYVVEAFSAVVYNDDRYQGMKIDPVCHCAVFALTFFRQYV